MSITPAPLQTPYDEEKHADIQNEYPVGEVNKGDLIEEVIADTEAAAYIDHSVVITPEENKRLLRKIYKRLVPFLCIAYVTQALDKGTLGTSSIMGWQANVGAQGQDYALTTTLLYAGIFFGEPIIHQPNCPKVSHGATFGSGNDVLDRGTYCSDERNPSNVQLLIGQTFSLSMPPILAIRFLLGLMESFFHPCLLGISVQWFLKHEQTFLISIWQSMFCLSNLISNLLAYAFYQIPGSPQGVRAAGLYCWQWMSLCIAAISAVCSVLTYFNLRDSPTRAKWLSEDEKVKVIERVRPNDQGIKQTVFRKDQALEILRDPLPWSMLFMCLCQSLIAGGLGTFNSLLINKAFGFTVSQTQLVGIPLSFFQLCLYWGIGYVSSKCGQIIYCMMAYVGVGIVSIVVLITVTPSATTKPGLLVAFYFVQTIQACNPPMWSMVTRNFAGQSKKSIVYAMFFCTGAVANVIAPQIFQSVWAPRYIPSLYIDLGLAVLLLLTMIGVRFLLVRRNRVRDESMAENNHNQAFADLTDIQNKEFRYSY